MLDAGSCSNFWWFYSYVYRDVRQCSQVEGSAQGLNSLSQQSMTRR